MRLFEAEELKKAFVNKGQRSRRYHVGDVWELNFKEICDVLDYAPTVEAIPIEWLKRWAMKSENTYNREQIVEMLNDWEEENDKG